MSYIRLTASTTFAIEMVHAVLAQKSLIVGLNLNTPWTEIDIELDHNIVLVVDLYGSPSRLRAFCEVYREDSKWVYGNCTISFTDIYPGREWNFQCELVGDEIIVNDV